MTASAKFSKNIKRGERYILSEREKMGLKYKKATPALDDVARARLWGPSAGDNCVSTSSEDTDELANLVDSFYDSDFGELNLKEESKATGSNSLRETDGGDLIEMLDALLEEMGDEPEVGRIQAEVESAIRAIGSGANEDRFFKERVVDRLRKRGFDAGI